MEIARQTGGRNYKLGKTWKRCQNSLWQGVINDWNNFGPKALLASFAQQQGVELASKMDLGFDSTFASLQFHSVLLYIHRDHKDY